jgi:gamma-glutamylcyclotransferase (GGCT)/AIG2-like uncharacterized protein YtfP
MPYYFAYGSNMDYDQFKKRCPNSKYLGKGFLSDYKLAFTRYSRNWESAVADVLVSPGDIVWGLIYDMTEEDLTNLDKFEGHPTIYKRKQETVMLFKRPKDDYKNIFEEVDEDLKIDSLSNLNNYKQVEVIIYEVVDKDLNLTPKINYLSKLQDAAFENFFPKEYQEKLYIFGKEDYKKKFQLIIDTLLDYQQLIESGKIANYIEKQGEWGGANLVVTGEIERKEQLNRDYPHDLVVLTPHWRELSWLVNAIYWDKKIAWQVDYSNKHFVLEQFGIHALAYQKEKPNDDNHRGICMAVLYGAYKVFTTDFYKMY